MKIRKEHLAKQIADRFFISQTASIKMVNFLFESLKAHILAGDDVLLSDFGKFGIKSRKSRLVRNFKTGQLMTINTTRSVKFEQSKNFKQALKQ